jgi:hypothetical protein
MEIFISSSKFCFLQFSLNHPKKSDKLIIIQVLKKIQKRNFAGKEFSL